MEHFERFYRDNVRWVLAVAAGRAAGAVQAEDLTQETFLRAWQHYPVVSQLPLPAQRAWLVQTVRHLATDDWRRQVRNGGRPAVGDSPAEPVELRLDVDAALAELSPEDRDLVAMRYVEGMNSREIGHSARSAGRHGAAAAVGMSEAIGAAPGAVGAGRSEGMNERELDRKLTEALRAHLAVSQEQEDALWAAFEARQADEAEAWAAFASALALTNTRLQLARRASMLLFNLGQRRTGR